MKVDGYGGSIEIKEKEEKKKGERTKRKDGFVIVDKIISTS